MRIRKEFNLLVISYHNPIEQNYLQRLSLQWLSCLLFSVVFFAFSPFFPNENIRNIRSLYSRAATAIKDRKMYFFFENIYLYFVYYITIERTGTYII